MDDLIKLMPNAKNAPDFESQGGVWSPCFHMNLTDQLSWDVTRETLEKFGSDATAYFIIDDVMFVNLEVCFTDRKSAVNYWEDEIEKREKEEKKGKKKRA